MIKDVIVNLTVGAPRDMAAEFAVSVASTFEAHLAGIGFAYEAVVPGTLFGGVAAELIAAQRAESEKAARTAVAGFESAARGAGLSAETHLLSASIADAADTFGRLARRYDISVAAQAEPDKLPDRDLIIEAALFESGRPVLVVPYIQRDGLKLDRVMVCWDGSRTAARAVGDAIAVPRAREVGRGRGRRRRAGQEQRASRRRHRPASRPPRPQGRAEADRRRRSRRGQHHPVARRRCRIDLIVMGGYGHSRLREFVLGGVTRGILASMTVPTLMSH